MDPTEARKVRERCLKRLPALKQERATWESPWRDMADYIEPRWTRFFRAERNQGHKKESKIINGTATYNLGTLQSGMMASITSPARPWFQMTTHDPDLDAWGSVRTYLQQVAMTLRMAMLRRLADSSPAENTIHHLPYTIYDSQFSILIRTRPITPRNRDI